MSWFNRSNGTALGGQRAQTGRHLAMITGLLVVLSLLVAACGPAATPAPPPAAPTEVQAAPTDAPVPPTEAPVEGAMITPSVSVADQEIVNGMVTIDEVVSSGPGWLVIHAQADGQPGPILGYSAVNEGTNTAVTVEIDASNATEILYAMLHTDAGEVGTWEFPNGPDAPVTVGEQVVTPAFAITGGLAAAEEVTPPAQDITPSVSVADQQIAGPELVVAQVVSNGPGWITIHAQADGKPGPILGYSPVASGLNSNVVVPIDLSSATATLYAMLHTDAGEVGNWEFPEGPDTPVTVSDQVVSPAFNLLAVAGDEAEVEMEDFQFQPKLLVIRTGTTVKFANKDEAQHTATSDTGVWDSGYLAKGEEFFFTFTEPGLYPYYCIPHGAPGGQGMAATIIVLR